MGEVGAFLPAETINYLICVSWDAPTDPDPPHRSHGHKTFRDVAKQMREIRYAARRYTNTICIQGFPTLTPCLFVWTHADVAVNYDRPQSELSFIGGGSRRFEKPAVLRADTPNPI